MVAAEVADALAAGQPIDIANLPLRSARDDSMSPAIMCLPGDVPDTVSRSNSPALRLIAPQHAHPAGSTAARSSGLRPTLELRVTPTHMLASNVEFKLTGGRAPPADRPASVLGGFMSAANDNRETEIETEALPDFNFNAAFGEATERSESPGS